MTKRLIVLIGLSKQFVWAKAKIHQLFILPDLKDGAIIYEQKIKDEINKLWQPAKKEVLYDENEELSMVAER